MHCHCDSAAITAVLTERSATHRADACRATESNHVMLWKRSFFSLIPPSYRSSLSGAPHLIRQTCSKARLEANVAAFDVRRQRHDIRTCHTVQDSLINSLRPTARLMSCRELRRATTLEMLENPPRQVNVTWDETGMAVRHFPRVNYGRSQPVRNIVQDKCDASNGRAHH